MKKIILLFLTAVMLLLLASCENLDKTELQKLIDKEIVAQDYTEDSYAEYKQQYDAAKAVLDDTGTSQTKIDEASSALEDAINSLVRAANFKALEDELAIEYPEEGYTAESYAEYREAYATALEVLGQNNARQSTVNSALKALREKAEALISLPDTTEVDLLVALNIDPAKYTASTYIKYKQLCDAAPALRERAAKAVTNAEVLDCKEEIKQFVSQLKSSIDKLVPRGDKTQLLDAYDKAFATYNGRVDGVPAAVYYSSASYKAFGDALAKAKEAVESDDMTQTQLDIAVKDLEDAQNALEVSEVRKQLYDLIVSVQKEYIAHYEYFSDASFMVLNDVINDAIDEYNSFTSTEESMLFAIANVENAIKDLEYIMIVGTGDATNKLTPHIFSVGASTITVGDFFTRPGEFAALLISPENADVLSYTGNLETGLEFTLVDGTVVTLTRHSVEIKRSNDPTILEPTYNLVNIGGLDLNGNESKAIIALGGNPTEYSAEYYISTLVFKDGANRIQILVEYDIYVKQITKIQMTYNPFA